MMHCVNKEWVGSISGLSLLLLIGCTESKPKTMTTSAAPVSGTADKKMVYAPDITSSLNEKKREAKKLEDKKDDGFKREVLAQEKKKESKIPVSGGFVASAELKPVYFAMGSSKLTEEAKTVIQENAHWLKAQPPYLVQITGVADSRGGFARNRTLAERRALNVKNAYLAEGLPEQRLQIATIGEDPSQCTEMTEDCLQLSRRADTFLEEKALFAQR